MRINMQSVADALGVSKATVSRALKNHAGISEDMKERVRKACDELGYKLNPSIQDIITERRGGLIRNIAYVLVKRDFADPGYSRFIDGIAQVLRQRQFHLHLVWLEGDETGIFDLPPLLRDKRIDGMLISGLLNKDIIKTLKLLEKPIVVMGSFSRMTTGDILSVQGDLERWCCDVALTVKEHDFKRVAYFSEKNDTYFDRALFDYFKYAMQESGAGFDEKLFYQGSGLFHGAFDRMKEVFASPAPLPFDCIVCWDTRVAQELAQLIIGRYGLTQEPDVTLVTCNPYKQKFNVPNIQVEFNPDATARHAAQLLLDMLLKPQDERATLKIQV